jgi:hypothetical protein
MRIHHLDCATMCPVSARLVNGRGGWLEPGKMVCRALARDHASEVRVFSAHDPVELWAFAS